VIKMAYDQQILLRQSEDHRASCNRITEFKEDSITLRITLKNQASFQENSRADYTLCMYSLQGLSTYYHYGKEKSEQKEGDCDIWSQKWIFQNGRWLRKRQTRREHKGG
jgi:hypothetical protein